MFLLALSREGTILDAHPKRLKQLFKKRSIGAWIALILGSLWRRLGDWQSVEWLGQHLLPKGWGQKVLTFHPNSITVALVIVGLAWFLIVIFWPERKQTQSEPKKEEGISSELKEKLKHLATLETVQIIERGSGEERKRVWEQRPDLALAWGSKGGWGTKDLVRLRNIGKGTAFNIGLRFSWPELSFPVPFEINLLHPDQETEREAGFIEKYQPGDTIHVSPMKDVLREQHYRGRPSLQVTVAFFDSERNAFEKPFMLEAGPGGR